MKKIEEAVQNNTTMLNSLLRYVERKSGIPLEKGQTQKTIERSKLVEKTRKTFPDEIAELVTFEEKDTYIMVKPKFFLGSERFAQIAAIIRDMNGEYVSAGRQSHFRIPKES